VRFVALGLSYKTAPIEMRERFAQHTRDLEKTFIDLKKLDGLTEACVISTCNRVEFYAAGSAEPQALGRALRTYMQSFTGIHSTELDPHLYQHEGAEGLKHLFRVASSLDSMVVGEPQILGQVKEAFRDAISLGAAGPTVISTFQRAFQVAKRIRTDTGIAENAVSMSFAAVELGRRIFTSLEGKSVLVLGAGKMSTLAAKHLKSYGVSEVRIANRSLQAAQKLADEIGGLASSLTDLAMLLTQADIVISSTASPTFIVDKKMMRRVLRERRYRAILFIDIAVPRDIDPSVGDLENCFVYDVDNLEAVLADNKSARAKEAAAAEKIVDEEVSNFLRSAKAQQVVPVIKALRAQATAIAESEIERTLQSAKNADKKTADSIRAMGQAIINKILHPVMTKLKAQGADGDPQALVDALIVLFDLQSVSRAPVEPAKAEPAPGTAESNVVPLHAAPKETKESP
jgi:glutamyl-tRNA reductase